MSQNHIVLIESTNNGLFPNNPFHKTKPEDVYFRREKRKKVIYI